MLLRKNFDNRFLLIVGSGIIALRSLLQYLLGQNGHSNDRTDFFMGLLFGVGAGMVLVYLWRMKKARAS